jgi:hypothetical protein
MSAGIPDGGFPPPSGPVGPEGGIHVSLPHVSSYNPFPHVDIEFVQPKPGVLGQPPLPLGKAHVPYIEPPCQSDHP